MNEDVLNRIYYDDKKMVSATKLYKLAKEETPRITMREVQEWLKEQETAQLLRQDKRTKIEYSSIKASAPRVNYQIDLMIYTRYEYRGWKYILMVVDVHSRYTKARPLKSREIGEVLRELHRLFGIMGHPQRVNADNEFNKGPYLQYFEEHNIQPFFSQVGQINKQAIVERMNRTLALYLQKLRLNLKNNNWVRYLDDALSMYNNTYHSTIRQTPHEVFFEEKPSLQDHNTVFTTFQVGDKVRIKIQKQIFDKGDVLKYSKEIYTIHEIKGETITLKDENNDIVMYNEDTPRKFRRYQLQLANTVKTQNIADEENDDDNDNLDTLGLEEEPTTTTSSSSQTRRSSRRRAIPQRMGTPSDRQYLPKTYKVGDVVETYFILDRVGYVVDRTNRRLTFMGTIERIFNTRGQEVNVITVNEKDSKPRFDIMYFNGEYAEKIPLKLLVEQDLDYDTPSLLTHTEETKTNNEQRQQRKTRSSTTNNNKKKQTTFEIGNQVQTYFKNRQGFLRDAQGEKQVFDGEIRKIRNSRKQEVSSITLSPQEQFPTFTIYYPETGETTENVPYSLFV